MKPHLFILIVLLASCARTEHNDELKAYHTESLLRTRRAISHFTREQFQKMEDARYGFVSPRIEIWLQRAKDSKEYTAEMEQYLEELKGQLGNKNISRDKTQELLNRLKNFETSIATIDSNATERLESSIRLPGIAAYHDSRDFYKDHFKRRSVEQQKRAIDQLINDVSLVNLAFVQYCVLHSDLYDDSFPFYTAMVSQNATILRPGEKLKIYAGVGAFSAAARPIILVRGSQIQITEQGYATYEIPVPNRSGTYSLPLQMVYFNQITGKEDTSDFMIEYEVFDHDPEN